MEGVEGSNEMRDWSEVSSEIWSIILAQTFNLSRSIGNWRLVCRRWHHNVSCAVVSVRPKPVNSLSTGQMLAGLTRAFPFNKRVNLRHLDVRVQDLKALAGMASLTSLTFHCCGGFDEMGLSAIPTLSHIRELDLSYSHGIVDGDVGTLHHLSSLRRLILDGCMKIRGSDISGLSSLSKLTYLSMYNCVDLGRGEQSLMFPSIPLLHLNLGGCSGLKGLMLNGLSGLSRLTCLSLRHSNQLSNIEALCNLSSLKHLDLWDCPKIKDECLEVLSHLPGLTQLDLGGCHRLTDMGLVHLLGLKWLQRVDLSGCMRVSNAGLSSLSGISGLRRLDLYFCPRVDDLGVFELAKLYELESLDLSLIPGLTDGSMNSLVEWRSLKLVAIGGCRQVSERAVQRLTKSGISVVRNLQPETTTFALT
ncbi:hypothetical protein BSKO_01747 [Bryopsis sp. KO-2023]|nr:hypothetical protein BSKO_01747 [Bryopsis sp. KO-2023]